MTPELPDDMVERAAWALADARVIPAGGPNATSGSYWDEPPVPPGAVELWRADFRAMARVALAAALKGCDVREEWGWRRRRVGDAWTPVVFDHARTRADAEWRAANPPSWWVLFYPEVGDDQIVRRLVISTPAEPVETEAADGC